MMIINGEADLQAYILSNNSKWDTCAGEAIIKALNGYLSNLQGE
jgi:fructose-1,6-bisphosphatase/inositol monophosphatase family enzyme